jgi:transposase
VPPNITIIALPPKSPELNPVENVWQLSATIGSPAASSNLTTISSITAARLGTTR